MLSALKAERPSPQPKQSLVGRSVSKHFEGHGVFHGKVTGYHCSTGYRIKYDDGDVEDVSAEEVVKLVEGVGGEGKREEESKAAPAEHEEMGGEAGGGGGGGDDGPAVCTRHHAIDWNFVGVPRRCEHGGSVWCVRCGEYGS